MEGEPPKDESDASDSIFVIRPESAGDLISMSGYVEYDPDATEGPFVHACDLTTINHVVTKFFSGENGFLVYEVDKEKTEKAGFRIVHEANHEGGQKYWHLYRPVSNPMQRLTTDCVKHPWTFTTPRGRVNMEKLNAFAQSMERYRVAPNQYL